MHQSIFTLKILSIRNVLTSSELLGGSNSTVLCFPPLFFGVCVCRGVWIGCVKGSGCLFHYNLCLTGMFHISSSQAVAYCGIHSSHFVSNCGESQFPFPKSWCHSHVTYGWGFGDYGSKALMQHGVLERVCGTTFPTTPTHKLHIQSANTMTRWGLLQMALTTVIPVGLYIVRGYRQVLRTENLQSESFYCR